MFCKGWVFCSWVILVKPFDDSGSTFEEFQHSVEFFSGHFYSMKYVGWVVIGVGELGVAVAQVVVYGL